MRKPKLVFAYPGDLQTLTGGYGYDRRVIAGLTDKGWTVDLLSLGEGFPFPDKETLEAAEIALAALPDNSVVIVDGLAYGVLEQAARQLANRLKIIALVHHPLCRENGLSAAMSEKLQTSEAEALRYARHVIVTSQATALQVKDLFSVPAENISVAQPGTDRSTPTMRSATETVKLLSVGTVTERKGYDLLFAALGNLTSANWQLDVVGGLEADRACVGSLMAQLEALQLKERVTFHGAVPGEKLTDYYQGANLFVLASRYEGYGMAYTEALAHGLPVIGSGAGAVAETLSCGGAIYCGVEDVPALQTALMRLIEDPSERQKLARDAVKATQYLPTWPEAVIVFETVIGKVMS